MEKRKGKENGGRSPSSLGIKVALAKQAMLSLPPRSLYGRRRKHESEEVKVKAG